MNRQYNNKTRKETKQKMAKVFNDKIQTLSKELQEILLDDLVTAFENRINVLNRAQSTALEIEIAEGAKCETLQT